MSELQWTDKIQLLSSSVVLLFLTSGEERSFYTHHPWLLFICAVDLAFGVSS